MLCDELKPEMYEGMFDGIEDVIGRIRAAHKFILSPEFAHAADGLVENELELERFLPWCRLPYRECWFEVAHADRPNFFNAPLGEGVLQAKPKRIGWLLTATNDRMSSLARANVLELFAQRAGFLFIDRSGVRHRGRQAAGFQPVQV